MVFSDASHANIDSMSSVGGHIVLIARCKKRSAPTAWSSSKIKMCRKVHTGCRDTKFVRGPRPCNLFEANCYGADSSRWR